MISQLKQITSKTSDLAVMGWNGNDAGVVHLLEDPSETNPTSLAQADKTLSLAGYAPAFAGSVRFDNDVITLPHAVLDEQDFQKEHGFTNDEALSRVYRQTCLKSSVEAKNRAEQDAKDVRRYLKDTRQKVRRFPMGVC